MHGDVLAMWRRGLATARSQISSEIERLGGCLLPTRLKIKYYYNSLVVYGRQGNYVYSWKAIDVRYIVKW